MHRGRPYKKNDQCHVEQKNWTHVRQVMGYGRIGKAEAVVLMNDIYFICGKLQNFFVPQLKLKAKVRIGSKWKKEYEDPKTPYGRVMSESGIPMETKHKLRKEFESLNPAPRGASKKDESSIQVFREADDKEGIVSFHARLSFPRWET